MNLSRIAQRAGDPEGALKWAEKAVELNRERPFDTSKKMAHAYFERGRARELGGEDAAALLDYEEAVNLFEGAGDSTNAAIAAGNGGETELRGGGYTEAIEWYERGIEFWRLAAERGKPADAWLLAAQRVGLSAARVACGALGRAAEALDTAIDALTASQAAPALLLEAQVRLAALSLFLDDPMAAISSGISIMDIGYDAAKEARIAWEVDVLRKYLTGDISPTEAREKIHELITSPARNSAPLTGWYFQRLGE